MLELSGIRERFLGRTRFRFEYQAHASTGKDIPPQTPDAAWKLQHFDMPHGPRLPTLVKRSAAPGAPWIIYFPGNDAEQFKLGMNVLEHLEANHTANLVALAYRGYEGADGTPAVGLIREDVLFTVRELMRTESIKPEQLFLAGFSIGGYFSGWTTSELNKAGQVPRGLVLFAPGYDLVMLRASLFSKLAVGDDYQMAPFLSFIRNPSLVLQGTADDAFHGPEQGKSTAAGLGEQAQYREFAGVKHEELLDHEAALRAGSEWLWSQWTTRMESP